MKNKLFFLSLSIWTVSIITVKSETINLTSTIGSGGIQFEDYTNNLNVTWNINTNTFRPVTIDFYAYTDESDYFQIFGISNDSVETLLYQGSGDVGSQVTTSFPNGKAKVVFISNGSVCFDAGYEGFCFGYCQEDYTFSQNFLTNGNSLVAGKLGVGITNPLDALHVNGKIRSQIDNYYATMGPSDQTVRFETNGSQYRFDKNVLLSSGTLLTANQNFCLKNGLSAITRMTILQNNGYVGIGTESPDKLLTVNGTIHAKEIQVDLTGSFADYVFNKDYYLKPLQEVNTFIQTNGHLPEIPSATEVKEKGINLAEMQVILLRKIEELTLYAIEQQKRIEELEAKLGQQKIEVQTP